VSAQAAPLQVGVAFGPRRLEANCSVTRRDILRFLHGLDVSDDDIRCAPPRAHLASNTHPTQVGGHTARAAARATRCTGGRQPSTREEHTGRAPGGLPRRLRPPQCSRGPPARTAAHTAARNAAARAPAHGARRPGSLLTAGRARRGAGGRATRRRCRAPTTHCCAARRTSRRRSPATAAGWCGPPQRLPACLPPGEPPKALLQPRRRAPARAPEPPLRLQAPQGRRPAVGRCDARSLACCAGRGRRREHGWFTRGAIAWRAVPRGRAACA